MANVKYYSGQYVIDVIGIRGRKHIKFKFDTGSPNTVIPISKYLDRRISIDEQNKIIATAKSKNMKTMQFITASGSEMIAIPTVETDVYVGDISIPKFYFYVTLGTTSLTPLLGDDFISNCLFTHSFQSDIIVTNFDINRYNKQFIGRNDNNIDLLEILSLSMVDINDHEANYVNNIIKKNK